MDDTKPTKKRRVDDQPIKKRRGQPPKYLKDPLWDVFWAELQTLDVEEMFRRVEMELQSGFL